MDRSKKIHRRHDLTPKYCEMKRDSKYKKSEVKKLSFQISPNEQ